MKDFIKKTFDLWVRGLWLKEIDMAIDKYNKLDAERKRQVFVVNELIKEYKERYPDSRIERNRSNEN